MSIDFSLKGNHMSNALINDINAQGENLQRVIGHLYGTEFAHLQSAREFLDNEKPIVFIGMTSAAYLCHPAEHFLSSQGRLAMVLQASDALYSQLPALRSANVVINSRSGKTVEIVKLAEALKQEKIPFLAITNEPDSPLADMADHVLWTNSHQDDLVSINIITAMMTATLILVAETSRFSDEIQPALTRLPALMKTAIDAAWLQADHLLALFRDVSPIYLLHRGASKGAANCARLVLEEVARRPAIAMESGEFRQGPIEVVENGFGAMVYILPGVAGDLNCRLAEDITLNEGNVYVVGNHSACRNENAGRFLIAPEAGLFQSVLEVVPSQILAYKLAQAQGWEPGIVRYISKVITTETGIPSKNASIQRT
jgi:glucosamine--fructose-6-phosphate aminotransferase (isomerizing)